MHGIEKAVLREAAEDFAVTAAPVDAIIGHGRRRQRSMRAAGASALSLTAVGLAVAVGAATNGIGGGAVSAPAGTITVAAAATPSQAPTFGTTVVTTGELGGTTWKLVRILRKGTAADFAPDAAGQTLGCGVPKTVEETYVQTADGKKVDANIGGMSCKSDVAAWDHSSWGPVFGWGIVGLAAAQGQPSPYGSLVLGLVDETKIAKVELRFSDGRATQTAKLVKAPAPETGTYFLFSLPDKNLEDLPGTIVYYDPAGHVVSLPAKP